MVGFLAPFFIQVRFLLVYPLYTLGPPGSLFFVLLTFGLFIFDATFSPLRLKLLVVRLLFMWAGLFQTRISILLDCSCIGSMAMPRV